MKCNWARQHVSLDSEGVFRPCCTWQSTGTEPEVTSIMDYYTSDFYRKLNSDLEDDIWPEGCEDCENHEALGRTSMRTESLTKPDDYRDAEIKFGNQCNLGCVMCSPYNSSVLQDEYLKYKGQHELFDRNTNIRNTWYTDESRIRSMARALSNRTELQFSGGEPTVNNYLRTFLDELIKCESQTVLKIRTNANNWPQKLNDMLKNFKKVNISVSIDATGKANNYIRWPSQWHKTERNVAHMVALDNAEVKLNPTVASYNVHLMPELWDWAQDMGITEYNYETVWTPTIFAANNSEHWQKEIFTDLCKRAEPCNKVLSHVQKPGKGLKETVDFFKVLDYNRGTNFEVLQLTKEKT